MDGAHRRLVQKQKAEIEGLSKDLAHATGTAGYGPDSNQETDGQVSLRSSTGWFALMPDRRGRDVLICSPEDGRVISSG